MDPLRAYRMNKTICGAIVWFIATLFVIYSFFLNTAAAVFADSIKTSLHLSNLQASLATGAFILGFACMQIPAGYLLDKFNARWVISSGIFLLALGNLLISFASNGLMFSLCNFVQGLGAAFAFTGTAILISQWFSKDSFPILFGLTQALSCILAGLIHYFLIQALQTHTWSEIYRLLAFLGGGLTILALLLVKTPRSYPLNQTTSLKTSLKSVIKNKQIVLCTLAAAMSFGILLAYAGFWYLPIQKFYSVNNTQSVIISAMIFIGIGFGTPLLGWYSNYLKSRRVVIHVSLVLGTMALLLGIYSPHLQIKTLIIIKTISFLIGMLLSGSMLFYTMVSEISTNETRGVALSLLNTGVFLTNVCMLFIPYLLITSFSTQFFTYSWILPFCLMIAILVLYFIKETYQ